MAAALPDEIAAGRSTDAASAAADKTNQLRHGAGNGDRPRRSFSEADGAQRRNAVVNKRRMPGPAYGERPHIVVAQRPYRRAASVA
jgi:hypothetical protein